MCRFIVTLAGNVPAMERLKASLPRPWKLVYGRKNEDGEWIAICEAPGAEGAWGEELGRILSSTFGDNDFEWWEENEYMTTSSAEKTALEHIKCELAARQDNPCRMTMFRRS